MESRSSPSSPSSPVSGRGVATPADGLGMGVEQFRELGHRLVDRVADHWSEIDRIPVIAEADEQALASLSGPVPRDPGDVEGLLELLIAQALANMQHSAHPRYFARVPSPTSLTGILGEWLGVGYNAIAASWAGGSGPSQLELVVVDWLAQLVGFPADSEGVLTSGGSLGNMTALAAAIAAGYSGRVYLSDQTHSSLLRGLRTLGVTSERICLIPARDRFRWSIEDVRGALDGSDPDRAIVIATAGSTNTGAIDPLDELADLCAERDHWFHIDGAYGAPAALTDSGRLALRGIERADSLTLDPHKWLFQPFDIGCVLVRRPGVLEACFTMNPEYLRDVQATVDGHVDLRNRGFELSRRARALKLWLTLSTHGTDAIAAAIERSMALAEATQALLERDSQWEVITPAQLGIVTFAAAGRGGPEHVERARALTASGFAAVSCTELAGRTVYRLCLINPQTSLADVGETLNRLGGDRS